MLGLTGRVLSSAGSTIPALLEAAAERAPAAIALLESDGSPVSYGLLLERVDALAQRIIGTGTQNDLRVALVLPNGSDMAVALLAAASVGIACPLNPAYRRAECESYFSDLAPAVLVSVRGLESAARVLARERGLRIVDLDAEAEPSAPRARRDPAPSDVALMLHTSGTMSRPRVVPLTHANLFTSATNVAASLELTPADRALNVMPLFHVHGIVGVLLASLSAGASVACTPGFVAPDFFELLRERRATWYSAVATMHQAIAARAQGELNVPLLRFVRSSSAALPAVTARALERIFGAPVIEAYGMTEAAHQVCANPLAPGKQRFGSVGIPSHTDVAILGEGNEVLARGASGEVAIRGTNVMRGYAGVAQPEASTGHWLRTGDVGRFDSDGYLYLEGRLKEIINRGGEKISPREIDDALLAHPGVAQAVAFSMLDERLGEDVAAAVILVPGATCGEDALRRFVAERLADFKIPRRIVIVDAFPLGPTGKIQRIGLAAKLGLSAERRTSLETLAELGDEKPFEAALAQIWREILRVDRVGRSDDFFDLGGDSILAASVIARVRRTLRRELSVTTFFDRSTLVQMALAIGESATSPAQIATHSESHSTLERRYPATAAQRQMWFLQRLDPHSPAYHNTHVIRLEGELDTGRLIRSVQAIVARHEPLRMHFETSAAANEDVVAIVPRDWPFDVNVIDLPQGPGSASEERQDAFIDTFARRPFDLASDAPFRAALVRLDGETHLLVAVIHHIASDRWSFGVLLRELAALYGGPADAAANLPPLRLGYGDCTVARPDNGEARHLAYWRELLAPERQTLELPADGTRPAVPSGRGGVVETMLAADLAVRVIRIGAARRATPFVTFLAAFCVLLQRYSGQSDILIGTPVAGRERLESEALIGLFINTLPVRIVADPNCSFATLLEHVRARVLELLTHQEVPFDRIVRETLGERDPSRSPLYDVVFDFHNTPSGAAWPPQLRVSSHDFDLGTARYDLSCVMRPEVDGRMTCRFEYNSDLFARASIEALAAHFEVLLESIADGLDTPIDRLPLASADERELIVKQWSIAHPPSDFTPMAEHDNTLDSLVARRAVSSPERIALVDEDGTQLTYAQLDSRANRFAHALRARGVAREALVGLYLERSASAIVAMLATLKAGGAYVPLDPAYPCERLAYMLSSTGVRTIVARSESFGELAGFDAEIVDVDCDTTMYPLSRPGGESGPTDLAYVMFTSGSTGAPKAVAVQHAGVVALVCASPVLTLQPDDVFLLHAPLTFDASSFLWAPLAYGARVAVMPRGRFSLAELGAQVARFGVTILDMTPALFHQMVEERLADLAGLRACFVCGDVLSPSHCARFAAAYPACRLVNGYGPTETTVTACFHEVTPASTRARALPIGRPTADARAYIVDSYGSPAAIGVPGELWLGGPGVARGYLNDPELSATRFIRDPFTTATTTTNATGDGMFGRLYRTGDRARWLPSGEIDFLGRTDAQVKIRGFRVEPGEIEFALLAHPGVRDAAVAVHGTSAADRRLVAYVAVRADRVDEAELRRFLQATLPAYTVPGRIVVLDALPMTPSGKLDRARLPAPATPIVETAEVPRSETERRVATIFARLLGIEAVGRDDDFFTLGGHSLLAMRAIARIAQSFGTEITLRSFFSASTVAGLACIIDSSPETAERRTLPADAACATLADAAPDASADALVASLSDAEVDALLASVLRERTLPRLRFRCVLLGESTLVLRCAEILQRAGHEVAALIVPTTFDVALWAAERNVALVTYDRLDDVLRGGAVDYLFSIINSAILQPAALAAVKRGAINLHDSQLPRYAGRYATTWAIAAGETTHAVTWHEMTEGVDAGRILKAQPVTIELAETALSLNLKCYDAALSSFSELVDELTAGTNVAREQNLANRTYHDTSQRLSPACLLDWNAPARTLEAFVRAHDFGSTPNPVGLPKFFSDDGAFACRRLRRLDEPADANPGTIVRVDDGALTVAAQDSLVQVSDIVPLQGRGATWSELVRQHDLRPGKALRSFADLPLATIEALNVVAMRNEVYWVERLSTRKPLELADFSDFASSRSASVADGRTPLDTHEADEVTILAAFCLYLSRSHVGRVFDLDYLTAAAYERGPEASALYARGVPLRASLECATVADAVRTIAERRAELARHETYARDIFARYSTLLAARQSEDFPAVAVLVVPADRFADAGTRAPLTFVLEEGGRRAQLRYGDCASARHAAQQIANGVAGILLR